MTEQLETPQIHKQELSKKRAITELLGHADALAFQLGAEEAHDRQIIGALKSSGRHRALAAPECAAIAPQHRRLNLGQPSIIDPRRFTGELRLRKQVQGVSIDVVRSDTSLAERCPETLGAARGDGLRRSEAERSRHGLVSTRQRMSNADQMAVDALVAELTRNDDLAANSFHRSHGPRRLCRYGSCEVARRRKRDGRHAR